MTACSHDLDSFSLQVKSLNLLISLSLTVSFAVNFPIYLSPPSLPPSFLPLSLLSQSEVHKAAGTVGGEARHHSGELASPDTSQRKEDCTRGPSAAWYRGEPTWSPSRGPQVMAEIAPSPCGYNTAPFPSRVSTSPCPSVSLRHCTSPSRNTIVANADGCQSVFVTLYYNVWCWLRCTTSLHLVRHWTVHFRQDILGFGSWPCCIWRTAVVYVT